MLRVLDLFSGIGGFSLGLEKTGGFRTVAFCEIEAYPRRVLARHWPGVPIYDDVRSLSSQHLTADGVGPVDVICGGFPCQDISLAGRGAGIDGERSGLWREYARLVGELRPAYVVTHPRSALGGLVASSPTFPTSGMMQSGRLFQRAAWVSHTCESGCGLWPTPTSSNRDNAGGSNSRKAAKARGTYISGSVNPSLYEWLMGFPIGWTAITP